LRRREKKLAAEDKELWKLDELLQQEGEVNKAFEARLKQRESGITKREEQLKHVERRRAAKEEKLERELRERGKALIIGRIDRVALSPDLPCPPAPRKGGQLLGDRYPNMGLPRPMAQVARGATGHPPVYVFGSR
jgi:hypothetical protein